MDRRPITKEEAASLIAFALSAMFVGALLVDAVSIADLLVNVIEAAPEPALVTSEVTASLIWSLSTWVVANIFLEESDVISVTVLILSLTFLIAVAVLLDKLLKAVVFTPETLATSLVT